jgi:hypothetical protein
MSKHSGDHKETEDTEWPNVCILSVLNLAVWGYVSNSTGMLVLGMVE